MAFAHRPTLLPLCLLALVSACATTGSGDRLRRTYGDQAQAAYAEALDMYFRDDCLMAEPRFEQVRQTYPYSRFAALAELRAADCMFAQDKFAEAIQAYQQFTRFRPSHGEVPYAEFQVAASYHQQIPTSWLLSPPAHERDQHNTHEALRLLRRFILDHPNHPLVARAQKMAVGTVELLAAHELYVARYYLDRAAPKAALGRLRTLLRSYGGSSLEPEALYLLGSTYETLADQQHARTAYNELVRRFPDAEQANRAQQQLAALDS